MRPYNAALIILLLMACMCLPASAGLTVVTSGPQTIVRADSVNLTGTGAENGAVVLWIVGRNYFDTKTIEADKKGNYVLTLKPEETNRFSAGECAFLIQDPGNNRAFEIAPLLWSDGIRIADQGKVVTNIGDKSAFGADIDPVVSNILNASLRNDTDDSFTPYYFYVEEPSFRFNRVGDGGPGRLPEHTTGESLLITGTTNIGPENQIHVEIRNLSSGDLVTARNIQVVRGSNSNQWTYTLEEPGLPAGAYRVTIGEQKYSSAGNASADLNILEYRIAGVTTAPTLPVSPGEQSFFEILLPLIISFAALVIIGIIIFVSLRK